MRRALAVLLALSTSAHAQAPDEVQRARELYASAEAESKAGDYDAAIRDYGGAFELTKDPALLFKIGAANQRAGKCDLAVRYYQRYLDGAPEPRFAATTTERIAACTAKTPAAAPATPAPEPEPTPAPKAAPATLPIQLSPHRKTAWLLASASLGFATLGGVLAYSARSSQNDVIDLYAGTTGVRPDYDATTKKRYGELVDQGHFYEHLSWTAFGCAGAAAIGAAILFYWHPERVAPSSGGVAIRF